MKKTLDLPDDLVQELKLRSVHERKKLKDVAAQVIRRGLAVNETTPAAALKKAIKLQLFECAANAPATKMTADELVALEQQIIEEEDLNRAGVTL